MRSVFLAMAVGCAWAQVLPPLDGLAAQGAHMDGQVIADSTGRGLRRVQVILSPLGAGRPSIAAQTDEAGRFELRDIQPGAYQLTARRDGYLTTTTFFRGAARMPPRFVLNPSDSVTDITFRLHPWAVIGGRIRFEDGDPAVGVRVDLYRRYHQRGREGVALAGQALTNDRGEYRAHNLPAGAYFVAANFEGDQTGPQVEDQPRIDGQGREVAAPSYTMTFFPNSEKLSEATPLRIREGDELNGIDIYLRPVQRVNLAGKITDGLTGEVVTAAALTMERLDAGGAGTVPAPSNLTFDRDQRFHLKNVAPGTYQLWVEAASENQRLVGRAELHVTNSDIENLEIAALPLRVWKGEMITATGSLPLPRGFTPQVTLEARSERGNVIVPQVSAKGEFDVAMLPGETYDVFVNNLPDNFYLSEIRVGGSDVRALGLSTSMAANLPFQIVADSRGARVSGGVIGEGATEVPWSGATVALIPDPSKNRLQWFRQGFADEDGAFSLAGVAPGRYILTAWFDEPPCDLYDTDQSPACRAAGMEVDVVNGARDGLLLRMKNAR